MIRILSDASTRYVDNISVGAYLLYSYENDLVLKNSFFIENLDNNYCEMFTIYQSLQESLKLGFKSVEVFTDSEFVIRKFYHLKGIESKDLRKLSGKIMSISTKFEKIKLIQVNRIHVEEAHVLCNLLR